MFKKNKLKNILYSACCVVLAAMLFVLTLSLCRVISGNSNDKTTKPTTPIAYSITYKMVSGGEVQEVYEPLFKENGNYPIYYEAGETITVSDLNGRASSVDLPYGEVVTGAFLDPNNSQRDFVFKGWYLDEACTVLLVNNSFCNLYEDITLYAKVSIGYWTKNY